MGKESAPGPTLLSSSPNGLNNRLAVGVKVLWPSSTWSGLVPCQHAVMREGGSPREVWAEPGAEGESSLELLGDAMGDLGVCVGLLKGSTSPSASSAHGKDVPRGFAAILPAGAISCLADAHPALLLPSQQCFVELGGRVEMPGCVGSLHTTLKSGGCSGFGEMGDPW